MQDRKVETVQLWIYLGPWPRDPRLLRWGELMPRHGGVQQMSFPPNYLDDCVNS